MVKQRNCSIDIFRYVCAVLVVAIHTQPFSDLHAGLGFVFTQILPRIAVPFFFLVAGYFYTGKLESGKPCFLPYVKRLFITYFIWSVIYFIAQTVKNPPANLIKSALIFGFRAVTTGSAYHFWFFPALFFAVIFTTLLFKIKCKKLLLPLAGIAFVVGCLGCSYYHLGVNIPVLGSLFAHPKFEEIRRVFLMGFPFFAAGYLVRLTEKAMNTLSKKTLWLLWGGSAAVWLLEIGLVMYLGWQQNIVLTFGLLPFSVMTVLVLLRYPLSGKEQAARACQVGANFTYYAHPLLLSFLGSLSATPQFLIAVAVCGVIAFGVYKWNHKIVNFLV